MNIVVFGQKWIAAEVLNALVTLHNVSVIALCPDKPLQKDGSGEKLLAAAARHGIPVVNALQDIPRCTLGIAAHCQRYIPPDVRKKCSLGVLAYHPSLLPRHRGRDAVRWAIAMREPVTGGTAYWMDDGADTGCIETQDWCFIKQQDTATELWRRELAPMGVRLLTECVKRLAKGDPPQSKQQDESVATWEPAFSAKKLNEK